MFDKVWSREFSAHGTLMCSHFEI